MSLDPGAAGPALGTEAAEATPARPARSSIWRAAWELLHDLTVAVLFCYFLITFVAQAFRVQGTSMEPLLQDGDRILVNKLVYRMGAIERGDVVVFWYPRDPSTSFIKRVVGRPGDRVEIRSGQLWVNGIEMKEEYLDDAFRDTDHLRAVDVRRGYYFVLGDHRRSSNDSRSWGQVPERYIYGRAAFRFWPLGEMGSIR